MNDSPQTLQALLTLSGADFQRIGSTLLAPPRTNSPTESAPLFQSEAFAAEQWRACLAIAHSLVLLREGNHDAASLPLKGVEWPPQAEGKAAELRKAVESAWFRDNLAYGVNVADEIVNPESLCRQQFRDYWSYLDSGGDSDDQSWGPCAAATLLEIASMLVDTTGWDAWEILTELSASSEIRDVDGPLELSNAAGLVTQHSVLLAISTGQLLDEPSDDCSKVLELVEMLESPAYQERVLDAFLSRWPHGDLLRPENRFRGGWINGEWTLLSTIPDDLDEATLDQLALAVARCKVATGDFDSAFALLPESGKENPPEAITVSRYAFGEPGPHPTEAVLMWNEPSSGQQLIELRGYLRGVLDERQASGVAISQPEAVWREEQAAGQKRLEAMAAANLWATLRVGQEVEGLGQRLDAAEGLQLETQAQIVENLARIDSESYLRLRRELLDRWLDQATEAQRREEENRAVALVGLGSWSGLDSESKSDLVFFVRLAEEPTAGRYLCLALFQCVERWLKVSLHPLPPGDEKIGLGSLLSRATAPEIPERLRDLAREFNDARVDGKRLWQLRRAHGDSFERSSVDAIKEILLTPNESGFTRLGRLAAIRNAVVS